MKYLFLIMFVALTAALTGCGTTEGGSSAPEIKWPASTGTVKISDTLTIGNKDYGYRTVDGGGLRGNGNQDEDQEAPFYMDSGSSLKRVIAKSWPESVSIREGNALLENVYIPQVGEDAVSTYKNHSTKKLTIRNCAFAKAEDKIIQLNEGTGDVLIEGCDFNGFKSAIRIKKGVKNVTIRNCRFLSGQRAVVLDAGVSKPTVEGCTYYNGVVPLFQE